MATLAAGGLLAGASPAHAASEGAWTVTALFSKPGWTTAKAKPAAVLKACRTGTGGSKFALGTPITVRAGNEAVLGSAPVTQVRLWKEGGRYIYSPTRPRADVGKAVRLLGYRPEHHWRDHVKEG